jgi:hypothetical protein
LNTETETHTYRVLHPKIDEAKELWAKHKGALPPSADENNDGKKVSCSSIFDWFRKACNFS